MVAASGTPITSALSAGSVTRSAIRRLVLARISAETTPEGRCGREDEVEAEGPAALGDVHQPGHEIGQVPAHGRELVDDDDQPRQRRRSPPVDEELVGLDVLGAGRGEDVLAPGQLGRQRYQRPLDLVRVQVGDHADGVRQPRALGERAAALVVDEHERHLVGPVRDGERGDDRLQQLRLPGAGRSRDQRVRPVLADVDAERPVVGLADDCQRGPAAAPPAARDPGGGRRLHPQHVQQPGGVRSTAPSSALLTSRIGAIDRASLAHQSGGTKSGLISGSVSSIACWTRTRSPSTTTTAWHSAGSSFSSASRQTA